MSAAKPVGSGPLESSPRVTDERRVVSAGHLRHGVSTGKARRKRDKLQRLAQIHCGDLKCFAVLGNRAACDHESLLRQQFGYAAV